MGWPKGKRSHLFHDLTGKRIGRLTVLRLWGIENGRTFWWCRCECGREKRIAAAHLAKDRTSCGCGIRRPEHRHVATIGEHGGSKTPEYVCWKSMLQRCHDSGHSSYRRYGDRGIRVCERWLTFTNFLADMGPRPSPKYSIDRIDNEGNYEPGNCRWATAKEQGRNTRRSRILEFGGLRLTLAEWAERLGVKRFALERRIDKSGWDVEKALTTPIRPMRRFVRGVK